MTPAQKVALDAMREAWSEAEIQQMLAGPALLDALCVVALEFGRDIDIDERELFRQMSRALHDAHGRGVWESQRIGSEVQARWEHAQREALAAAENGSGASTPQPHTETACYDGGKHGFVGAPRRCYRCGLYQSDLPRGTPPAPSPRDDA